MRPNWTRPDQQLPGQRPPTTTVINNQTNVNQTNINQYNTNITNNVSNVTNNVSNVNQWFQKNTWQNRVTINSQHWNGRPWWHRPDYGDWHHGHWHGNNYYGGSNSWNHVDSTNHQWLNGLTAWGLGNIIYRSGYTVYGNPYYARPISIGTTTIDYSRPICVQRSQYEIAYANDERRAKLLRAQALSHFAAARILFHRQELERAHQNINQAIALMPDDTSMHEFRALVLFAAGNYRESAEAMHAVLAVAPGWDWTTLSGLYRDQGIYTDQLRRLENYVRLNPRDASARFLLAYHYVTVGAPENAASQLRAVLALMPDDRLTADLLRLVSRESEAPQYAESATLPINRDDLQGDWKARRPDGDIELEFDDDEFKWDYDLDDNDDLLRGKYSVDQDVLILATNDGSQLIGTVSMQDRDRFTFRLLGASETDLGLQFVRR